MEPTSACLDTSALIALLNDGEDAHTAVLREFQKYKSSGMVFITEVVFAEASAGMSSAEELRLALDELGISDLRATDECLFSAGQVFKEYRRSKGTGKKDGVLPDFMIGAVAKARGVALITLNDRDFVNKFSDLAVINPVKT
ncbi:tRNA(fMet)-specific endonuclease VapC [Roseovarius sp. EC-HK134]|uniref:tRNA(fMet)-specific endonuclease VapC n=2 Tax=Rhodobacterales TaxID=204455 RepID=A0A1V0RV88_9RHOB|nr:MULTISPECIES: PIN domain-containing protein [Rhodobacterales]ARE85683.1 tRNA(fMet)-specific endonuclease VapC [Roseovarius mucosus]ARU03269.1 tRNA(fMet)-specific endonuclease VapC [Yoonia vestfoldensis]MBW4976130.1 PIN domain-containing protein [Roseovarius mucosus]VVS96639.1 tRNA(fMet)-specific endonuclease VapC [Roseovarius sp. EC-SD190]VVT34243.1 tRNA(fMet)-specific endonuclease VapC [Roseovarius sp. EC-HK134]